MKLDETNIRQSNRLRFCEVIRSWLSFIITLPVSRPLIKLSDQRRWIAVSRSPSTNQVNYI